MDESRPREGDYTMKEFSDVKARLDLELKQWFNKQDSGIERYYLYFLRSTPEHDSGLIIAKDKPANTDFELATEQPIFWEKKIDQNFNYFADFHHSS